MDDVKLESARQGVSGDPVSNVEQCTCVDGYVGQFCESCAPGYHRDPENGGPLARCVPCNCNGHSDVCDVNTGEWGKVHVWSSDSSKIGFNSLFD